MEMSYNFVTQKEKKTIVDELADKGRSEAVVNKPRRSKKGI